MAETELNHNWDFQCPQYVDFTEPLPLNDNADKWFDVTMGEDVLPTEAQNTLAPKGATPKVPTPKVPTPKVATPKEPTPKCTPKAAEVPIQPEGSAGPVTRQQSKNTTSNIFSSLEQWRGKKTKTGNGPSVIATHRSGKPATSEMPSTAANAWKMATKQKASGIVADSHSTNSQLRTLSRQNSMRSVDAEKKKDALSRDGSGDRLTRTLKRSNSVRQASSTRTATSEKNKDGSSRDGSADGLTRTLKRSNSVRQASSTRTATSDKNKDGSSRDGSGDRLTRTLKRSNSMRQASSTRTATSEKNKDGSSRDGSADGLTRTLKRSNSMRTGDADRKKAESVNDTAERRTLRRSNSTRSVGPERVLRTHSTPRAASVDKKKTKVDDVDAPSAKVPRMLTVAVAPGFMKRLQTSSMPGKVKSSEDQQLEEIAQMRQELTRKRRQAQESHKRSKMAPVPGPVHSRQETTAVVEFKFSTDERVKPKDPAATAHEESQSGFTRSLRSYHTPTSQPPRTITRIQPFRLSQSNKEPAQVDKFQSVAESIIDFHKKTPDRYRSRPRGTSYELQPVRGMSSHLTQPKTPHLEARNRHRPVHVTSQKEIDDLEFEEAQKHQFKARPVNTRVLSQLTGIPKTEPRPNTEIEGFSLHLEKRIKERQANRVTDEEEDFTFHAQPIPKNILGKTVGVKPMKSIPLTIAQSPAFALKHRVRLPVEMPEEKEDRSKLRVHPVPHVGVPFQPKLSSKFTKAEPFSFEQRYRNPRETQEAMRKRLLEEEQKAREFRANPLPNLDPVLPERHSRHNTKPEPFVLQSDIRGEKKSQEWSVKVEEELAAQKTAAEFKANPVSVLDTKPFIPLRSTRALTDVSDVVLNTERRAFDRDYYELRKKAREAELAEINHTREQEKQEEENAAIAKLRAEMNFKCHPVKKFKTVQLQSSEKPLTKPESPRFSTRICRQ